MTAERFYVYRCGATDACVLTQTKGDPRLPPAAGPDRWQFWMQTGRLQAQDGQYGFNLEAALKEIAARLQPLHRLTKIAWSSTRGGCQRRGVQCLKARLLPPSSATARTCSRHIA
jgi:hypothetical protein